MKKILTIGLLTLLISCIPKEIEAEKVERKPPVVETEQLTSSSIHKKLRLSGDVVATNLVDVYPDVPGKIDSILVDSGDKVSIDTQLALIDRNKPGMNFAPSPVLSPIKGTITEVFAKKGGLAAPSMPLFRVGTLDKLEIVTNISEKDLNRIKLSQEAIITTDTYPSESFTGVVKELNPVVNPVTRTLKATISVDRAKMLRPGMFVDLEIITDSKSETVVVSRDNLIYRNGKYYLWTMVNEKAYMTEVLLGLENDNNAEIISGVSIGDTIITKGFTFLEDGIKVRLLEGK